jgi:hypothetical protein
VAFDRWLGDAPAQDGADDLLADEPFPPRFVALGAAGPGARGVEIHRGSSHGSLSMARYAFA